MENRDLGSVFDAAAATFAEWTPLLWDRIGRATVDAAAPAPGAHVLDACCGNGAATLPAARAVGPDGRVDGVDLANRLLDEGKSRAAEAGLTNATFHNADVTTWNHPDGGYDTVFCLFGIFFLPDMDAGGAHLLSNLRPGGTLAVTTWAPDGIDALIDPFFAAVRAEVGDRESDEGTRAIQAARARVDDAEGLSRWLTDLGAADVSVREHTLDIPVTPELGWSFVTGAGPRRLLNGLDDHAVTAIRERYLRSFTLDVLSARYLIGQARRA